jgi:hypothetical protein
MNNIYKITKVKHRGELYVQYHHGFIKEMLITFDPPLQNKEWEDLISLIPLDENLLPVQPGMPAYFRAYTISLLQPRTVNEKLAAFCMQFRGHRNSAYTPKKNERANVAQVTMSDKLLEVYFTNDSFPLSYAKSINDYIRHYNYIRDIAVNGKPVKSTFPDVYDREYERTLEGEKLSAYWQHLNKLGWKKVEGIWIKVTH